MVDVGKVLWQAEVVTDIHCYGVEQLVVIWVGLP